MWARRCGVRKHWPSRIRVTIHSFINALVGITIFRYLTAADVGYLDLSDPMKKEVLCLSHWPERAPPTMWFQDDVWVHWKHAVVETRQYVAEHQCPVPIPSMSRSTCSIARIPVRDLQRHLGYPLAADVNINGDIVAVYSGVFVYIGFCLFVTTAIHDLSLLTVKNNSFILDLQGVRRNFPTLLHVLFSLTGIPCIKRMAASGKVGCIATVVLAPFALVWFVLVVLLVWYPVAFFAFLWHPVRLSRLAVFVISVNLFFFGLSVTIHSLVWLSVHDLRPLFAVTWAPQGLECDCGCVFHIKQGSIIQMLFIGLSVTFKAFMYSFRCLKGLRRTNWASLLTVLFPVPLAVYPVRWTQPDGLPILHRVEGEPVQGELAFDPFALMDEQPESAHTTLRLAPTPIDREQAECEPELAAPPSSRTLARLGSTLVERIGCCGFPYLVAQPVQNEAVAQPTQDEAKDAD